MKTKNKLLIIVSIIIIVLIAAFYYKKHIHTVDINNQFNLAIENSKNVLKNGLTEQDFDKIKPEKNKFKIQDIDSKILKDNNITKDSFGRLLYSSDIRYGKDITYKKENTDNMFDGYGKEFPKFESISNNALQKILSSKECQDSLSSYDKMREILGDKLFYSWFFDFLIRDYPEYEKSIINNCTDPGYYPLKKGNVQKIDIGYEQDTYTVTVGYGANGWQQLIFTKNNIIFMAPLKSRITQGSAGDFYNWSPEAKIASGGSNTDFYISWSPKKLRPCNNCEIGKTVTRLNYDKNTNTFIPIKELDTIYLTGPDESF